MKTIDFISLGCSKNLVDSELLMGLCQANGYMCTHDSEHPKGEIVVVNTCGFIADAKEESINTILSFAEAKTRGQIEQLYVMGCLSERYLADLENEIPEVDGWYGKFNYRDLLKDIRNNEISQAVHDNFKKTDSLTDDYRRVITTPGHYAYLKISEGCDRHCAYCAIPIITGRHRSRPIEDVLAEVEWLVDQGVKEFQVIAQELTYYGQDLYGEQKIAELVERMAKIPGVKWIRLHYAYPTHFPWDLTRVMRENSNVCKYLDIALQHISDKVLSKMRRNITKEETLQLIERLRAEVPGITLRTTLMVGFPGETEEDYRQLLEFTRQVRFERMGAFAYSEEEGTYSSDNYKDDIADEVKQQRLSKLMRLQQDISAEIQEEKIGQRMIMVVDRLEGDFYVGRGEDSSPEVDPEILVSAKEFKMEIGHFYNVEIYDAEEFDLYAKVIEEEI